MTVELGDLRLTGYLMRGPEPAEHCINPDAYALRFALLEPWEDPYGDMHYFDVYVSQSMAEKVDLNLARGAHVAVEGYVEIKTAIGPGCHGRPTLTMEADDLEVLDGAIDPEKLPADDPTPLLRVPTDVFIPFPSASASDDDDDEFLT